MKAKILLFALPALILAAFQCLQAAQQPTKVHRIGILPSGPISPRMPYVEAFRQGLHELRATTSLS